MPDPNLFHLDWERVFEALVAIIVLAFIVERALSTLFESKVFLIYFDKSGVKETIALAVCIAGCLCWHFDVISIILLSEHTSIPGEVVTGAVIAGGSKASIKLFHDILNIKSSTFERRHELVAAHSADVAVEESNSAIDSNVGRSDAIDKVRKLVNTANAAAQRANTPTATNAALRAKDALSKLQSQVNLASQSNISSPNS